MPTHTVDLDRLYSALDRKRRDQGKSWRELARELDLGPSRFRWMSQGGRISVDTFVTLLAWLELDAERFVVPTEPSRRRHSAEPSPSASLRERLGKDHLA
jgi:hypothetical protein